MCEYYDTQTNLGRKGCGDRFTSFHKQYALRPGDFRLTFTPGLFAWCYLVLRCLLQLHEQEHITKVIERY